MQKGWPKGRGGRLQGVAGIGVTEGEVAEIAGRISVEFSLWQLGRQDAARGAWGKGLFYGDCRVSGRRGEVT